MILTKKSASSGQHTDVIRDVAELISLQWIDCNVYPMPLRTVEHHVQQLFDMYAGLKTFSRKSDTYWSKCTPFPISLNNLFDVAATDDYPKICENVWNVKMTSDDKQFLSKPT